MKIQTMVLKDIYLEGKKVGIGKISRNTGLTKKQVSVAVWDLQKRRLIKLASSEIEGGGYKSAPHKKNLYFLQIDMKNKIEKPVDIRLPEKIKKHLVSCINFPMLLSGRFF